MKTKLYCYFIALALLVSLAQTARSAVGFTVTPAAVSNTYNGSITLSVTGLTNNGDTVVIQDYLDANTNGVIDAGDLLSQQFTLTDGQASVFHDGATAVTNFNVPGDTDGASNSAIAAKMFFLVGSPQAIIGQHEFRLFSPTGHFTAMTNQFSVTNFPYAQAFTGSVVSNGTGTTLPNAIVLLFDANNQNMNLVGGTVADNAGKYTISAPAGTYSLAAFKSNYVANTMSAANLVLGSGVTNSVNLSLVTATQSISGRVLDVNNSSLGIPGFIVPVATQGGLLTLAFTDTNGNFTARVNADQWKIESNEQGLMPYGYVSLQNGTGADTTGGNVSGVTIAVPKATAIFYGSVKDSQNHPLAGISLHSQQQNNSQYESEGITDANGNYVAGALAGDWGVGVNTDSNPTNFIFSQSDGATLTAGQAYLQNFTALIATNHITGNVSFNGGPVPNVQVSAFATISGTGYQAQGITDNNGNYSLNVANGNWGVNVSCSGGDNTLDNILGNGNYQCPGSDNVTINNNNGTADFTVDSNVGATDILTYYLTKQKNFIQTNAAAPVLDTSFGPFNAYLGIIQSDLGRVTNANVTLPTAAGRAFPDGNTDIELQVRDQFADQTSFDAVYPSGNYTFNIFTLNDGNHFPVLNLPTPVYPNTPHISNFTPAQSINPGGDFLLQWDAYSGGTSNDAIFCEIVGTNGAIVFSTPYPGTDFAGSLKGTNTSVTIPAGTLPFFGSAYSGALVFFKTLGVNTTGYPGVAGLTIASADTTFVLHTLTNTPTIGQPTHVSATQFGFNLGGLTGNNYTVLTATNLSTPLSNWLTLVVTNLPAPSVFIQDNQATNKQRFYRIKAGP